MEGIDLSSIADEQLAKARESSQGRSARTLYGGSEQVLRQTVLALTVGQELAEHDAPPEATLQVLRGRVRLPAGEVVWEGSAGEMVAIPRARHSLFALEDAVVLLTVVSPR